MTMIAIATDKYIYPPRPKTSLPFEEVSFFKDLGWVAQYKYNGSRCVIKHLPNGKIELWNRHAEKFRTYNPPTWLQDQIRDSLYKLGLSPTGYHLLDGELLDQKHVAIKDTVVIWDILVRDGQHLLGTTYGERHSTLHDAISTEERWLYKSYDFGIRLDEKVLFATNFAAGQWDGVWSTVLEVNKPFDNRPLLEGLVIKDPNGVLERGWRESNNGDWLVRCRVKTGRHNF